MTDRVQMSTKVQVQDNLNKRTFRELSAKSQIPENMMKKVADEEGVWLQSFPEYTATKLILTQKEHQSSLPAKKEAQASWKGAKVKDTSAEGLAVCKRRHLYGSECHHGKQNQRDYTSFYREARQRGSEADGLLRHFSAGGSC